jgi:polar amino acid transport system substrate-binding protein
MKNKLLVLLVIIIVMTSAVLISCSKAGTSADTTKAATAAGEIDISKVKTIKSGVLTVGSDCTWQPMEFIEGDKIVGFDVDLTKAIAEKLGLKLDYQNTAWDGMFPAVIAHKFDMVISSITITDERKKEMDFSDQYYRVDQSVSVKKDSGIDSVEKLNGKKAGVQIGTTGEVEAKKMNGVTVKTYDDIIMAFEDLRAGRVDAIICDSPVGDAYAVKNPDFTVGFKVVTNENYGMGFAKDTPELVKAVNLTLKALKEDGTYDKITETWFGAKK